MGTKLKKYSGRLAMVLVLLCILIIPTSIVATSNPNSSSADVSKDKPSKTSRLMIVFSDGMNNGLPRVEQRGVIKGLPRHKFSVRAHYLTQGHGMKPIGESIKKFVPEYLVMSGGNAVDLTRTKNFNAKVATLGWASTDDIPGVVYKMDISPFLDALARARVVPSGYHILLDHSAASYDIYHALIPTLTTAEIRPKLHKVRDIVGLRTIIKKLNSPQAQSVLLIILHNVTDERGKLLSMKGIAKEVAKWNRQNIEVGIGSRHMAEDGMALALSPDRRTAASAIWEVLRTGDTKPFKTGLVAHATRLHSLGLGAISRDIDNLSDVVR